MGTWRTTNRSDTTECPRAYGGTRRAMYIGIGTIIIIIILIILLT
jgi:hypothetical protein